MPRCSNTTLEVFRDKRTSEILLVKCVNNPLLQAGPTEVLCASVLGPLRFCGGCLTPQCNKYHGPPNPGAVPLIRWQFTCLLTIGSGSPTVSRPYDFPARVHAVRC